MGYRSPVIADDVLGLYSLTVLAPWLKHLNFYTLTWKPATREHTVVIAQQPGKASYETTFHFAFVITPALEATFRWVY